ncbi:MAG: helix-turn-helix domain-containing protein [Deltaproteobacteria bacterium]|nr:helix-turn-helix domain-containing protein [Deltaproteobacteria bacterium]
MAVSKDGAKASGPESLASRTGPLKALYGLAVVETLRRCGGNKTHAAKELGLSREGLRKKLKKMGLA